MPEAHAKLSASGSAKWLSCSASLALEALINVPDYGNEFTWEGTAAHELLYRALSQDKEPSALMGEFADVETGDGETRRIKFTHAMVSHVEVVIEYVQRLSARNSFYEEKVDYSHIAPGGFGTADIILEVNEKVAANERVNTLYVIDFKYGKGIRVDAFENSQGMLYALGALNTFDMLFDNEIERVVVVIAQPRMDHIDEYEISVDKLKAWGDEIKPKAEQAANLYEIVTGDPEIELSPGAFNPTKKGCKWCQGNKLNKCKAQAQAGFSAAVEGFDDLTVEQKNDLPSVLVSDATIKDPAFLDNDDLAAVYQKAMVFQSFINGLTDEIIRRTKAGEATGFKLIPTKGNRAWIDDDEEAIKAMRTAGLQKKDYEKIGIISPTEAEKLLKEVKPTTYKRRYKKLAETAIHRPTGKDKLVENNAPAGDFDDLLDTVDYLLS